MASAAARSREDRWLAMGKEHPPRQHCARGRRKKAQLAPQEGHENHITRSHEMMQPKGVVCSFCLDLPDVNETTEIHVSTGIKLFTLRPEVIKRLWLPNTFIKLCLRIC